MCRRGAAVLTKSDRVQRDLDVFASINSKTKAVVQMSLTIADEELSRKLKPNVCNSRRRYEVLKEFQEAGIPTGSIITRPWMDIFRGCRSNIMKYMERVMKWSADRMRSSCPGFMNSVKSMASCIHPRTVLRICMSCRSDMNR